MSLTVVALLVNAISHVSSFPGCQVHAYEPLLMDTLTNAGNNNGFNSGVRIYEAGLAAEDDDGNYGTLETHMKENGHEGKMITYLKVMMRN